MNNAELSLKYAEQLKSGKAFIYGVKPTSNPNQMQLEIAQQISSGLETSGPIDFNAISLGWKSTSIARHWQGISVDNLQKMGGNLVIGKPLDEAYAALFNGDIVPVSIKTEYYTKTTDPLAYKTNVIDPVHAGREGAKPVVNPQTSMEMTHNGEKVYRKTSLLQGEFTPQTHNLRLQYDTVEVGTGAAVEKAIEAPAIA
jgi:hypothetical protein